MCLDYLQCLFERLLSGDRRSIAKMISIVENNASGASRLKQLLHERAGKAHIVGITGSPGTGKSTLVARIAAEILRRGRTIGILAVDPTSPFTGGALLGDRIRMQEISSDPGVFIRSMGSRGAIGGLAAATNDAITILDASGKDVVLIETVGAGQVEVDIVRYAHTSVVVTMPGSGDEIQAIKSGIMEIGDIFCVNKGDREGAARAISEIKLMLDLSQRSKEDAWLPPVISTTATTGEGLIDLVDSLEMHWEYLRKAGLLECKRRERAGAELLEIINRWTAQKVNEALGKDGPLASVIDQVVVSRELDPHAAAGELFRWLLTEMENGSWEYDWN